MKSTNLSGMIGFRNNSIRFILPGGWATFFAALILLCGIGFPAAAKTLLVPNQHASIQKALDAAQSGDAVQVSEGIYIENIRLKQGVALEGGWNADFSERNIAEYKTIIDGGGNPGWTVLGADDAEIDGFTIINATILEINGEKIGAGIRCESTSPTIRNNTILNNAPAGIFCLDSNAVIYNNKISNNLEAGVYFEKSNIDLHDNIINSNEKSGVMGGGETESTISALRNEIGFNNKAGMEFKSAKATVRNNIIHNNELAGIVVEKLDAEIINNTIAANKRSGVLVLDENAKVEISNNIISHNGDPGIMSEGKGYSHNLLFANNKTEDCDPMLLWCVRRQYGGYEDETSYFQQRDLIADPLYVDFKNHDYRLTSKSPAIDAGKREDEYLDVNFPPSLGSPRNDLGAFGGPLTKALDPGKNDPPRPEINYEAIVSLGEKSILDASPSIDPNGDEIRYSWALVSKPEGSRVELSRTNRIKTRIQPDSPGIYEVALTVSDRWGDEASLTATLTVMENRPPIATAAEMLYNVFKGDLVTLDGSLSSDADDDPLSYQWSFAYKPEGSLATISDPFTVSPTFVLDADGCYLIRLDVNDGRDGRSSQNANICTTFDSPSNERNVPSEYPTIQTAIDAADEGDKIIVKKGVYTENIIIDKKVDLLGVDWPTIDGGSKEGDENTVMITYLGKNAGRLEGFIITGSGHGDKGHGINIWDSSPTIANNHVAGNAHNGIGIHGSAALTEDTKIFNNLIYDNMNGIGNGRGSRARIFNNQIFNNKGVGIGARGLAAPTIEGNDIYGNHVGIGAREVAAPFITGNHIHDNVNGIIISPISLVRGFAGNDVEIFNNLVFANKQVGISVSSFNLSKISIRSNTIAYNNQAYENDERGGGLSLGFPLPAGFEAVIENNIISGNKIAEIINYTGPENYKKDGASVHTNHNNVWNENEEIEFVGVERGDGDFSANPMFTSVATERNGGFFLSQLVSGQEETSPCVDSGNALAADLNLGDLTSATKRRIDMGIVDLGYHYPLKKIENYPELSTKKSETASGLPAQAN